MTSGEFSFRFTRIARHSLLCSSRMFRVLNALPSSVRWCTKSYDQTWFRYSGRSRTHDPSLSQRRPFLSCFIGTFSPSRRQSRSTRLSFTCQPASLNRAATRRYPYRPNWRVSSIMSSTKRSSSARPRGNRRCVDRCWPRTRQTRRSETLNSLRTWSMQARRREGLRSFPMQLPSGSTYPMSGQKPHDADARSLSVAASVP